MSQKVAKSKNKKVTFLCFFGKCHLNVSYTKIYDLFELLIYLVM